MLPELPVVVVGFCLVYDWTILLTPSNFYLGSRMIWMESRK